MAPPAAGRAAPARRTRCQRAVPALLPESFRAHEPVREAFSWRSARPRYIARTCQYRSTLCALFPARTEFLVGSEDLHVPSRRGWFDADRVGRPWGRCGPAQALRAGRPFAWPPGGPGPCRPWTDGDASWAPPDRRRALSPVCWGPHREGCTGRRRVRAGKDSQFPPRCGILEGLFKRPFVPRLG